MSLKNTFAENLIRLQKEHNASNADLAKYLGISASAISLWKNGKGLPRMDKVDKICSYFGITREELMNERISSVYQTKRKKGVIIPVLGYVAGGEPLEMNRDIIDELEISEELARKGNVFALKIRGDSMTPRIKNGDVVIVIEQPDVESGQLAVVAINGDVATCKQVKKHHDGIELIPYNPSHATRFFSWDEVKKIPVRIIGRVVELRAKF